MEVGTAKFYSGEEKLNAETLESHTCCGRTKPGAVHTHALTQEGHGDRSYHTVSQEQRLHAKLQGTDCYAHRGYKTQVHFAEAARVRLRSSRNGLDEGLGRHCFVTAPTKCPTSA